MRWPEYLKRDRNTTRNDSNVKGLDFDDINNHRRRRVSITVTLSHGGFTTGKLEQDNSLTRQSNPISPGTASQGHLRVSKHGPFPLTGNDLNHPRWVYVQNHDAAAREDRHCNMNRATVQDLGRQDYPHHASSVTIGRTGLGTSLEIFGNTTGRQRNDDRLQQQRVSKLLYRHYTPSSRDDALTRPGPRRRNRHDRHTPSGPSPTSGR